MMLNAEIAAVLGGRRYNPRHFAGPGTVAGGAGGLQELAFPDNLGLLPHDDISRRAFTMMRRW